MHVAKIPAVASWLVAGWLAVTATATTRAETFTWSLLAELPDHHGVAGCYAGVCDTTTGADLLVVAGGANFPMQPPWEGGTKVWHDTIWVLSHPTAAWQSAGRLPRPLGYGISASYAGRVWCVGGGDRDEHLATSFSIGWDATREQVRITENVLPPLPQPVAFGAGLLVGSRLFIAGGQASPTATKALPLFCSIDLAAAAADTAPRPDWQVHPSWPGAARMLPVLGSQGGHIYLVSGAELLPAANDAATATRRFLSDGFVYDPAEENWAEITGPPLPLVAAPTPAVPVGFSQLLFLPGDDGALFGQQLADQHPGFPRGLLLYDRITDRWRTAGEMPALPAPHAGQASVVTTPAVAWRGQTVIPSGEVRPGVRTPAVRALAAVRQPAVFGGIEWLVLGGYLACLIGIGIACSGGEQTTADFFLGGRRIPWWAAGISIFGTTLSAITFLAIPARSYATDWSTILLNGGILAVAPLVAGWYLPAIRQANVTTAYEFLEQRFGLSLRLFAAASFSLFQLARMGIVILLPALAVAAVTGIPVVPAILVMGLLATLYTVLGGIEAVIWTDVLQVVVLVGAAVITIGVALAEIGGLTPAVELAAAADKLRLVQPGWSPAGDSLWVLLLGAIFSNALVPYTTDQTIIQRYLTTPDEAQAARAIWTNALIAVPVTLLFFALGTSIFCVYQLQPETLPTLDSPAQLVPWFAATRLPAGCGGLVVAGVLAAAMSSLDSGMHSVSTVLTNDVLRRFRPATPDTTLLRAARLLVVLLGAVGTATAVWMARVQVPSLWDFFITVMGMFGGPLAGVFFLAVFQPQLGSRRVWIGVIAAVAAVGWLVLGTTANGLLAGAVGWAVCVLVALAAAVLVPARATASDNVSVPETRAV
ncbi:MAG: sodium:solute symporter [Planctomycetia bacterium]|nr:sodium:solute symporter [Planctomycetia bacterium]